MKTVKINGKTVKVTFRTNSEMYTRFQNPNGKTSQFGADVYDAGNGDIVIVATAANGASMHCFNKVLSAEQYESISDLYDPYNAFKYHAALMNELGFK